MLHLSHIFAFVLALTLFLELNAFANPSLVVFVFFCLWLLHFPFIVFVICLKSIRMPVLILHPMIMYSVFVSASICHESFAHVDHATLFLPLLQMLPRPSTLRCMHVQIFRIHVCPLCALVLSLNPSHRFAAVGLLLSPQVKPMSVGDQVSNRLQLRWLLLMLAILLRLNLYECYVRRTSCVMAICKRM